MTDIDRLSLDFAARHPDSFARVLGRGSLSECEQVIASLPAEQKAAIAARLPASQLRPLLDSVQQQAAAWLVDAPFDEALNLLSRMSRERRLALLNQLSDPDRKRQLLRHQQYPAHSVGALIADVPLRLVAHSRAQDVVAELRELDTDSKGPVVVVDADGRYLGVLDRWKLLLRNPPRGKVQDYCLPVRAFRPETSVASIAGDEEWYTRNWLPVIDHRERVLGVLSREKVLRAAEFHSGNSQLGGDLFLQLLEDLVLVFDALLVRMFSGRNAQ